MSAYAFPSTVSSFLIDSVSFSQKHKHQNIANTMHIVNKIIISVALLFFYMKDRLYCCYFHGLNEAMKRCPVIIQ